METHTIKLDTEVLNKRTLVKGHITAVEVNKYYDLDGTIIDEGKDVVDYPNGADFEIISKHIKYNWEYMEPTIFERWELFVNGMRILTDLELTGYKVLKNKVILQGCTGAG